MPSNSVSGFLNNWLRGGSRNRPPSQGLVQYPRVGPGGAPAVTPVGPQSVEPNTSSSPANYSPINYSPAPTRPQPPRQPSAPSGFNYSQVTPTPTPSTVNTANPTPPPQAPSVMADIQDQEARAKAALKPGQTMYGSTSPSSTDTGTTRPPPGPSDTPPTPASAGAASRYNSQFLSDVASQNLQRLREQAMNATRQSPQEQQLADELTRFQGNARMGISSLEGQGRGIPLPLIRGQQAQLQEQAGIQEQTLLQRLQNAQGARASELEGAKLALGFQEQDNNLAIAEAQARQAGLKPIEVDGNLLALNPDTGEYEMIYQKPATQAEGFTLGQDQQRFDAAGNLLASGPTKAQEPLSALDQAKIDQIYSQIAVEQDPLKRQKMQAEIDEINRKGTIQADPKAIQNAQGNFSGAQSAIEAINRVLDNPQFNRRVGAIQGAWPAITGEDVAFDNQFQQMAALLTFPMLSNLKGLGAMSDREFNTIKDAAGALNRRQDEASLRTELDRIKQVMNNVKIRASLMMTGQFTPQEIEEYISQQSFNQEGGGSQQRQWVQSTGNGTLTQDFNTPVSYIRGRSIHGGLDIDGKIGDPVSSPVSGRVVSAGPDGAWGNSVVIEDAQGNRWRIAHMHNVSIRPGTQISQGMALGQLGNTGYVLRSEGGDGSHVHIEIKDKDGNLINPHSFLG